MCTVVFIPNEDKFFMASLRDEDPIRRIATIPVLTLSNQQKYIAPVDPQGGGTWVGINENGFVIVLLNGGFINHTKKASYARSRGQIVRELLSNSNPYKSWFDIDLHNMEPFTLIIWSGTTLWQLVWDGENKYQTKVDETKAHIWSSATLYDETIKKTREQAFNLWVTNTSLKDQHSLLDFFKQTTNSNEPLFIKNGLTIKTLSYTCIEIIPSQNTRITYHDLSNDIISSISLLNIKKRDCGIHQSLG